jgi:hypothetical protein
MTRRPETPGEPSEVERRLYDALDPAATQPPAPDLFERVLGSIADGRIRRRRTVRTAAGLVLAILLLVATVVVFTPRAGTGRLLLDWWILELFTDLMLVGLALWLGPFIKRFGRAYAADVFHDNPQTGKSYIVLTDIVYYLIFSAYILFTVSFQPRETWSIVVTAPQAGFEAGRIGGILLIIGILHGLNIILMPVLGRLFSLNRKISGRS